MATKPEMLLLSGLPASGKTTEADDWVAEDPTHRLRINWDDLRLELYGPDWHWNRKDEEAMKKVSREICSAQLRQNISVVVDNTNLSERTRASWAQLGKELGATVTQQEVATPVAECVRRDRAREKRVGQAVIDRMALTYGFIDWGNPEVYHPSACGKDFVVVDVDGTLADCEHRRHYVRPKHKSDCFYNGCTPAQPVKVCSKCGVSFKKNWPAFFKECVNDLPIQPVLDLVHLLSKKYYILIVSGRPMDLCGKATEDWLLKYNVPYLHLFMRDNGDSRDDTIVKKEIAELLPQERIAYVIDDRPKVLRMWQEFGLTTLAVGNLKEF
jgi:predicted kinase